MQSLKQALFIILCATGIGAFAALIGTRHRSNCERIAKVTEVFNDTTYAVQTIDLCHGPVR